MRRAFGEGNATLVLIGDPKQAIYAFRGADVYAYLEAARAAGTQATLGVNWRSDQGLIDAYDAFFRGARFGHEGIAYRTVRAADANQAPRLFEAPVDAPLRLRVVHRADGRVRLTRTGYAAASPARELIAADLAADVVALLSSGAEIDRRGTDGSPIGRERIRPAHVAVLVRTNRHAALVRDALDAMDVPAVINGAGSVFGTPVAREWLRLMEALERPTSPGRARSAALTPFLGWTAERVASAGDAEWEDVHGRLHRWAGVLRRRGVASLLEAVTHSEGLPQRMLSRADGERQLTDLRHIGQLLHAEATAEQLGVTALTTWLRQRVAEASADTDNEERSRRLESDAEAVQVLTIHRSKGLEYPVVYFPYLWDPSYIPRDAAPIYHDPANGDRRTVYVGAPQGDGYGRHYDLYLAEQRAEDLRLAYVALTRAQHQAVVWWAGSYDSRHSPLGRLLFSREPDGNVAPEGTKVPSDDAVAARFDELAAEAKGCVSVERAGGGGGPGWAGAATAAAELAAGVFGRVLDPHWRRTSYSAITAAGHEARVASEPEETVVLDEPAVAEGSLNLATLQDRDPDEARLRAVPSLLATMPGGVDVGTFVHRVLECVDFAAEDLDGSLADAVSREAARRHVDIGDPALAVAGLEAAVRTPLGSLVGDRSLADFARPDRLDELGFELPLVGGDSPAAVLDVRAIGALLRRHLPAGDPLASYADRFADPGLQHTLRGYLSGSLDVVLRLRDGDDRGAPRFAVVDHKTNWLGTGDDGLSAWHYRPAALAEAMQRAHYPLQALLYTVALHRYLRWRLPGYDPGANLAGVLYMFLRGMTGPEVPRVDGQPCGVFAWHPPAALVEALSDLLDQGTAAA
jgi:exodeoxyribonuclease V beta subunit